MAEVVVTTTEEQQTEPIAQPNQSLHMIVGELKAQVGQLLSESVTKAELEQMQEQLYRIPHWTQEEILLMIQNAITPTEQTPTEQTEIIEDLIEQVEEQVEEVEEQVEEIPIVPQQVQQEEPEQTSKKSRPWWL